MKYDLVHDWTSFITIMYSSVCFPCVKARPHTSGTADLKTLCSLSPLFSLCQDYYYCTWLSGAHDSDWSVVQFCWQIFVYNISKLYNWPLCCPWQPISYIASHITLWSLSSNIIQLFSLFTVSVLVAGHLACFFVAFSPYITYHTTWLDIMALIFFFRLKLFSKIYILHKIKIWAGQFVYFTVNNFFLHFNFLKLLSLIYAHLFILFMHIYLF